MAQIRDYCNCLLRIPFSPPPPCAAGESSPLPPHAFYVPCSRPAGPTTSPWWPPSAWSSRRRAKRGEALAAGATGVGGASLSRCRRPVASRRERGDVRPLLVVGGRRLSYGAKWPALSRRAEDPLTQTSFWKILSSLGVVSREATPGSQRHRHKRRRPHAVLRR